MQDHGDNENMNTLTTIRITSYATDLHDASIYQGEESDAESFHSAITSATKGTTNARSHPRDSHKTHTTYMIKYESRRHSNSTSRPGTATNAIKTSDDQNAQSQSSRPSSRRSSKSSPSVPRRKSSLVAKKKTGTASSRKVKPTNIGSLHRQSCQVFSSLDGVLALSRDITPLPSVSSSRSTTRHPSLIPEEETTTTLTATNMAQMCEKLDAKLAYTYSYSYSLNTDSTASISLHGPKSDPVTKPDPTDHQIVASSTSRRPSSEPQSQNPDHLPERPPFNTVISWTSDATRRKEYAKIDRANSGFRGLLRRLVPKPLISRNSRRGFFTGKCDGDSVRRFRMDVADDDGGDEASKGNRHHTKHSVVTGPASATTESDTGTASTSPKGERGHEGGKAESAQQTTQGSKWLCF